MLAEILNLIEKIPATFWGVVIGAFFSLGGVALTNRANDRRLHAQLAHDRDMKSRERELSLRRDVYLAAAEAVSAGLITVSQFSNLDIPHDKLTEAYIDKSPSITKVYVIASEQTAKAVTNFVGELGAAYLRLFAKRYPLVAEKGQLTFLKEQMDGFSKERDRMVELMKQFNLDGKLDQRQWDVINKNFQFESNRVTETIKQHATRARILYASQIEYMKECIAEHNRLSRLLVPVLISVRAELALPINETAYMEVIEESIRKQEVSLKEFIQNVKNLAADEQGSTENNVD